MRRRYDIKPELSISILDCPLTKLVSFLSEPLENTSLHIDLIDTSYCPNISFGLNQTMEIINMSELCPIDLHCMFKLSENLSTILHSILDKHHKRIRDIYIQIRSMSEFIKFFKKYYYNLLLKYRFEVVGLAIDPDFCLEDIKKICQFIEAEGFYIHILQMTVKAGQGNQSFYYIQESIDGRISSYKGNSLYQRICKLRQINDVLEVSVDGGINLENLDKVLGYVDRVIIGSAFHNAVCQNDFLQKFK